MNIEQIARHYLGIDTLAVRNSDSLDFHDLGVAGVKAALQAAFAAGQQASAAAAKKPVTASEHYAATLAKVQNRLEQLTRAVEAHALRQAKEPGHWGYIGDISALDLALTEALGRVGAVQSYQDCQDRHTGLAGGLDEMATMPSYNEKF